MVMFFREGGPWMYGILALGLGLGPPAFFAMLLGAGAFALPVLRWPARILGGVTAVASVLPAVLGLGGWLYARRLVEAAVVNVSPEHRELLLAEGYRLAAYPMWFGIGVAVVIGFGGLVGLGLGLAAPSRPEA